MHTRRAIVNTFLRFSLCKGDSGGGHSLFAVVAVGDIFRHIALHIAVALSSCACRRVRVRVGGHAFATELELVLKV